MKLYNTYAEAKIDNPDCEIVASIENFLGNPAGTNKFRVSPSSPTGSIIGAWVTCDASCHCSTVAGFLDAGYKFEVGDIGLDESGSVRHVEKVLDWNTRLTNDDKRYILRAAALNGGCKIPTKEPKMKAEYVKVEASSNEIAKMMIDGEVFYSDNGKQNYRWDGGTLTGIHVWHVRLTGDFYRKVEK